VTPAFVSLLCICIVSCRVLSDRRRALPVRADGRSRDVRDDPGRSFLSRTLVPTMANYLLQPHHPSRRGEGRRRPAPAGALPARLRGADSSAFAAGYHSLLELALSAPADLRDRLLTFCGVVSLVPFLGRNFFSRSRRRNILDACPHPGRHPRRGNRQQLADVQKAIRKIIPPRKSTTVATYRMPISGINMNYNNTGVIGPADGDTRFKLKKTTARRSRCAGAARAVAAAVSGTELRVPAADIVSQILNFGAPAPIDLQVRGATWPRILPMPTNCSVASAGFPDRGCADPAIAEQSDLQHR